MWTLAQLLATKDALSELIISEYKETPNSISCIVTTPSSKKGSLVVSKEQVLTQWGGNPTAINNGYAASRLLLYGEDKVDISKAILWMQLESIVDNGIKIASLNRSNWLNETEYELDYSFIGEVEVKKRPLIIKDINKELELQTAAKCYRLGYQVVEVEGERLEIFTPLGNQHAFIYPNQCSCTILRQVLQKNSPCPHIMLGRTYLKYRIPLNNQVKYDESE